MLSSTSPNAIDDQDLEHRGEAQSPGGPKTLREPCAARVSPHFRKSVLEYKQAEVRLVIVGVPLMYVEAPVTKTLTTGHLPCGSFPWKTSIIVV